MKDDKIFIEHILDAISKIELFVKGVPKSGFKKDIEKQYAVIRGLEIMITVIIPI